MTEPDRLILQALTRYEAGLCECGHHKSESMDPTHDRFDPEHTAAYHAERDRCFACTALAEAQHSYAKSLDPEAAHTMHGLRWSTALIPRRVSARAGA